MSNVPDALGGGGLTEQVAEQVQGLLPGGDVTGEEETSEKLAAIEMAGEEVAAGWKPSHHPPLSPEVQYLHVSRTINQLISDRNRSVGIFLFVASVLIGASSALINAQPQVEPIIPMSAIVYWCMPVTFATLSIIGVFMCLILIRSRSGLIYEVAKMNVLLGLPSIRVNRVSPLSIFYLMHLLVALLGGVSGGFALGMALSARTALGVAVLGGSAYALVYLVFFLWYYAITVQSVQLESGTGKT